jgi:hypothetical protein
VFIGVSDVFGVKLTTDKRVSRTKQGVNHYVRRDGVRIELSRLKYSPDEELYSIVYCALPVVGFLEDAFPAINANIYIASHCIICSPWD